MKNDAWYFSLYKMVWTFHKRHIDNIATANDAYWRRVIDDADQVVNAFEKDRFALDLVEAVIGEFERIGKEGKNHE